MTRQSLVLLLPVWIALAVLTGVEGHAQACASPPALTAPFDVSDYFFATGLMGDGKAGEELVQQDDQWKRNCHSRPVCIRVEYSAGPKRWAGVYWQYPEENWGEQPGRRVEGASKIVFWARGETGTELVQFKAGGIFGDPHWDCFEQVMGVRELGPEWREFTIDLEGKDTSMVIGAFAWTAKVRGNPRPLVFYLDDIRYEP